MTIKALELLSHAQKERLAFIDFSLQYFGQVTRADIIQRYKTGLAAATRDFSLYKEYAADNLILKHQTKSYHRVDCFQPLFEHNPDAILAGLCRGFGDGLSNDVQPSEVCFNSIKRAQPNVDVVSCVMRAITNQLAIRIKYFSVSNGESIREIIPHSIANNGSRWHVRAYDRKNKGFRDFVLSRLTNVEIISAELRNVETKDNDAQWNCILELDIKAHPDLKHKKAIELDHEMHDGLLTLEIRAALVGYLLNEWRVDCSENNILNPNQYQLALVNRKQIINVENNNLAPGYFKTEIYND